MAVLLIALVGMVSLATFRFSPVDLENLPDLSFQLLDGGSLSTAELANRPALITFWSTSCGPCLSEIPEMNRLYADYAGKGFQMLAVAMDYDSPEAVRETRDRLKLRYPLATDTEARAVRAFGNVRVTPTHFLIGPNGSVLLRKIGRMDFDDLRTLIDQLLPNVG